MRSFNSGNLISLFVFVLLVGLAVAHHKCLEKHNNCIGCLSANGCGFCGIFQEEGWCIPQDYQDETGICPSAFWKLPSGDPSADCAAPLRITEYNQTADRVTYTSLGIGGQSSSQAVVDVLFFASSQEADATDDDDDRSFTTFVGYGFGDLTTVQYEFFGLAYSVIVEYDDPESDGFDCESTASLATCPDFARIVGLYDLAGNETDPCVQPIAVDVNPTTTENQTVFIVNMTDCNDYFMVSCRTSNGKFSYEGLELEPYSFKCDVFIKNYPYAGSDTSLSLGMWLASLSINDTLADPTDQEEGDVTMGGGLAHFRWSPTARADGTSVDIVKTDIVFVNETVDIDPTAQVVGTFFSFLDDSQPSLIFWDPRLDVTPVPRTVTSPGSALRPFSSWLFW